MATIKFECPCGKLKALNENGTILALGIPFAITREFDS